MHLVVIVRSIAFGDGVGGMERAASDHIRAMSALGIDITLITAHDDLGAVPVNVRVKVVRWPSLGPLSRALFGLAYTVWVRRVRRQLSLLSFDVAHFHGASVGAVDEATARRAVSNPHGMEEFGEAGIARSVSRAPTRRLSRRAAQCAYVISTDSSITSSVVANLGVSDDRIVVIPNAVDAARLRNQAAGAKPFDHFILASLGRVVPNKGHDLLLEALRDPRVSAALPIGWTWHHFGSGPGLSKLKFEASKLPSVNLVAHEGATDTDVQQAISVADLFVQPSRYEGSSLTVLEAMAHGTSVIATPVGGIPDKVRHLETGRLAKEVSAEALADEIVDHLSEPRPFADAARRAVDEEFSWESAAHQYLALYRRLM